MIIKRKHFLRKALVILSGGKIIRKQRKAFVAGSIPACDKLVCDIREHFGGFDLIQYRGVRRQPEQCKVFLDKLVAIRRYSADIRLRNARYLVSDMHIRRVQRRKL